MIVDWDVPVEMSDGNVLRADVFRPRGTDRYPVLLGLGPYAKGLPFSVGYPDQWRRLVESHPEVMTGSSGRYQNWEVPDPEKWVPLTPAVFPILLALVDHDRHGYAIMQQILADIADHGATLAPARGLPPVPAFGRA